MLGGGEGLEIDVKKRKINIWLGKEGKGGGLYKGESKLDNVYIK